MNLRQIARGWYQYLKASTSTRELMLERLEICESCPMREEVTAAGNILAQITNDKNNLYRCGLCKCPLGPLTALHEPACKAHKWKR